MKCGSAMATKCSVKENFGHGKVGLIGQKKRWRRTSLTCDDGIRELVQELSELKDRHCEDLWRTKEGDIGESTGAKPPTKQQSSSTRDGANTSNKCNTPDHESRE